MISVQNFAWSGFSKTAKVKSGRISRFILFLAWFVRLTMVGGHRICKLSWAGSPWIKRIYAKRSKSDLSTWDVIRTKSNFQKKYSAYFGVFTIRPSLLWVYKQSWLFVGISHPTKSIPIPKVKNPESRGFRENPGDKIPKLRKIPNLWDFGISGVFYSEFFRDFQIPMPIPGIFGFSGFFDLT